MTEEGKLKFKARKQLKINSSLTKNQGNTNVLNIQRNSKTKLSLKHNINRHPDNNYDKTELLLKNIKTDHRLKNVFYDILKDNVKVKDNCGPDKAKHKLKVINKGEIKQMITNKNTSELISNSFNPLIGNRNHKTNANKMLVVHHEKISPKLKTELKNLTNFEPLKQSMQDNFVQGAKSPFEPILKSQMKVIINNKNITFKQSEDKQQNRRNRGLVCKNSHPEVEAKKRKKQFILNHHMVNELVKKASTNNSTILKNEFLKNNFQSIDEKHSVFAKPSQTVETCKRKIKLNKCNPFHTETISKRIDACVLNETKNGRFSKTPPEMKLREQISLNEPSHHAIARKTKKKKKHYNTPTDSIDVYKNKTKKLKRKTDYYIVMKKQSDLCGFRASICLELPHSIDKSCKEDLMKKELTEFAVANSAQITEYGDGKFNELSDKNPKLLTLLSRTFSIKRNGRDITLNETSKALLSDTDNLLNSAKDKHKSEKSSQRKQKRKKYKLKEVYNRKITETSCFDGKATVLLQEEKSNLKELKESSKQFNTKELNTFVVNKDKDHYHLPTRADQEMLLNSNRRVFSHKLESSTKLNGKLSTITSKNCLHNEICNILNSDMNVFEDKYKEGNKIPIEKENTSVSMSSPNWSEKQENDENLSLPQNMEELDYSLKERKGKLVVASPVREEELVINDCSVTNNCILSKSEIENINLRQNNNVGVKSYDVSEVEVQTDVTGDKTIDFGDKLITEEDETCPMIKDYISIDKYCRPTRINRSLFNENEIIPSLDRKSFVRIISDKDELKKEKNIQSEFESTSKDCVYNVDCNSQVQSNSYEGRHVEFHQENLHSVISENNKTKNEIVDKINTIYEILQNVDKVSKSNVLQQQNTGNESSNKDLNNIFHCFSDKCSEVLIKIKADVPDEMSRNLENQHENKEQFNFLNKRHKFINIIDDDTKKRSCETDLNLKESKNLFIKDVFENKCLMTTTMSKTQSNNDNMASGEINAEQILQTKPIQNLQSIDSLDKQTGFKNKESNHDEIDSFSMNIVECPPSNNYKSTPLTYEKIDYNWFEPVTPPAKKRQLFVKIISEDSSKDIKNQEDQISTKNEDFIPYSFGKRLFKHKSLYSKVDYEPLVESVLSSQNFIEKNKHLTACNHQKLNNSYYKLEQGDIANNTGEKYKYFDSSPLSKTINNCETKDECWESKCKYNVIKQGKNILERRESSYCKISNKLKTQEMSCNDKKSNKNKGLFSSGKKFIKYLCSKSVCNVAGTNDFKPEGNIEHKYQENMRLDPNTFNPNVNPSKMRNTSNYENNFRYCSQIYKFDYNTERSKQSPHIDESKLSVEDEIYENTPSSLIINSTEAIDSFLTKKFSDKYYSSSTESLQQLRDKEKKSWEILEKNSKIYTITPNNILNNVLTNTSQSLCREENSLNPMFPSFTKDSKNINDNLLRKVNIYNNFKSIASRKDSCATCSVCSFDSDLNCELLTKSLTFRNKNMTMLSEESKQRNQNTNNSKINLFKTAANNQFIKQHKILSESPILYDDESKIQQIKTNSRVDVKEPFVIKEHKCKSSISTSSFNSHNKSKTNFDISREREQLKSYENNQNSDHINNAKIGGNVALGLINNTDDEWISINKCDFQKSCFTEREQSNLQDNNVGLKMNIKLSDMHIELLCQIPDLNCVDKT